MGGGGGERGIILHSFNSIPFRQQQLKANERMDVHCVQLVFRLKANERVHGHCV